ncbi:MAG: M28 family metallopeptidase [Spirochaetales bacterium]|nr:M28 family metallopeptidase [Spirochaetales bacterium]
MALSLSTRLPLPHQDIEELYQFCQPQAHRFDQLCASLHRRDIPFEVLTIQDFRHILLPPPQSGPDDGAKRVLFVAHYDRVHGTPGANDNAAAVFQLMAHWEQMRYQGWKNTPGILFTDGEELTPEQGPQNQGSWAFAQNLQKIRAKNLLFFVFDMCGIGNTPLWGMGPGFSHPNPQTQRQLEDMEQVLLDWNHGQNNRINPLFSDDLGLLLAGYPALRLSLLPKNEAQALQIRANQASKNQSPQELRAEVRSYLPPSWKVNHGPGDGPGTLQAVSFRTMERLLRDLARHRFS